MNRLSENILKPAVALAFAIVSSSILAEPRRSELLTPRSTWVMWLRMVNTPSPERIALRVSKRPLVQLDKPSSGLLSAY
jgi:hypothetical protein